MDSKIKLASGLRAKLIALPGLNHRMDKANA
jgi:hypothetical protein